VNPLFDLAVHGWGYRRHGKRTVLLLKRQLYSFERKSQTQMPQAGPLRTSSRRGCRPDMHLPEHAMRQIARLVAIAMTRATTLRLFSILCVSFARASAGQEPTESHEEFVCSSGAVRKIVGIYNHASLNGSRSARGACRVEYTSNGKTRTLWSSSSDHAYCTTKALALVTKLIQGNYTCKPESVGVDPDEAPMKGDHAQKR
jgi:hypothetical protein